MAYRMKMAQPATLTARMNPNIAASRPHSRAVTAVCSPLITETALPPRTGVREQARSGDRTRPPEGHDRCGTVPGSHRTSLAGCRPRWTLGSWAPYKPRPGVVKAHQMIRCSGTGTTCVTAVAAVAQIYGSRAATG